MVRVNRAGGPRGQTVWKWRCAAVGAKRAEARRRRRAGVRAGQVEGVLRSEGRKEAGMPVSGHRGVALTSGGALGVSEVRSTWFCLYDDGELAMMITTARESRHEI